MNRIGLSLLVVFVLLGMISCSKRDSECDNVDYNISIVIEKGNKYCFPDNNYFIVEEMKNEFCPCNSNCKWEGEMKLIYKTKFNDVEIEKTVGSSLHTDSLFMSKDYIIRFSNIKLKTPCNNANPSPEIIEATVVVIKK